MSTMTLPNRAITDAFMATICYCNAIARLAQGMAMTEITSLVVGGHAMRVAHGREQ
jgi:hypothetical protein